MKGAKRDQGWLICFLLNLAVNPEWVLGALVLYGLHRWLGIPWWPAAAVLALWIGKALVITGIALWAGSCDTSKPSPPNKNPYSKKNSDYMK